MTRIAVVICISTIIAFCMLSAIGCSTNNKVTTDKVATSTTSSTSRANKNTSNTDKVILRCGSVLTKTKKPCRNRVAEDSFCHLHAAREAATPTTPSEFLQ